MQKAIKTFSHILLTFEEKQLYTIKNGGTEEAYHCTSVLPSSFITTVVRDFRADYLLIHCQTIF
jgi:hypothetical protein